MAQIVSNSCITQYYCELFLRSQAPFTLVTLIMRNNFLCTSSHGNLLKTMVQVQI